MGTRVLVPLDDSEPAFYALNEAVRTFPDAEIIALYVIETREFGHGPDTGAAQSLLEARKHEAIDIFDEAQRIADDHNITLERAIQTGNPATEIVAYATSNQIDHIVMGSHGRTGLSRLLLGSVAEHVLRNAPTSVMIARPTRLTE